MFQRAAQYLICIGLIAQSYGRDSNKDPYLTLTSTVKMVPVSNSGKIEIVLLDVVAQPPKTTQAKFIDKTIRAKRIAWFAGSSTNVTMNASLEPQAIKK